MTSAVTALQTAPATHLAGTDLRVHLVLGRNLLNILLAQRPSDTPVRELFVDPDPDNQLHVQLAAVVPVIGRVSRRLTLVPGPAVELPGQPWLHFQITDGFRFLDKPLIGLMEGQIRDRLPAGVELTSNYLRLDVGELLRAGGKEAYASSIRGLQLSRHDDELHLDLHLNPPPSPPSV